MSRIPAKRWTTREDVLVRIEFVRKLIEDHPVKYSLNELAELANLSPYHFQRVFKKTYGRSPTEHSQEFRLRRAHLMLSTTRTTVIEASFAAGYEDVSAFCRAFKSRFGYSPKHTPRKWSPQS